MGVVREPKGVDLIVGPSVLTEEDKTMISEIIANYKRTGKLPPKAKSSEKRRGKNIQKQVSSSETKRHVSS